MQQINIGVERLEATLAEFIILLLFLIYRKCNYNKKLVVTILYSRSLIQNSRIAKLITGTFVK